MTANVSFNPVLTTNALGSFNVTSVGYVQGTMLDDPVSRFALAGGVLAAGETIPMWGGVGIYENIPGLANGPAVNLGGIVGRATALTGSKALTGFSVFNQAHAMIQSPQSPVPLAGSNMSVNFFRLGSKARLAVKCDPNLVSLQGLIINTNVSWDFVNQMLVPYASTTISSGTYNNGTGAVALTTAAPHGLSPGDTFELDTLTGTGAFASLNGEWTAITGTTGSTINFTAPSGLGATTITGGNITTGGILPVKVLDVQVGNSMTVSYDSVTGFATWNRTGTTAIILI